eukprot:2309892-Prymnesium_polylepis.2
MCIRDRSRPYWALWHRAETTAAVATARSATRRSSASKRRSNSRDWAPSPTAARQAATLTTNERQGSPARVARDAPGRSSVGGSCSLPPRTRSRNPERLSNHVTSRSCLTQGGISTKPLPNTTLRSSSPWLSVSSKVASLSSP